ncbi:GNAT family N-acetyltransferase [Nocardioides nanhaiensis]|uniref:N-acetyltransferase domain-containing protein n=1 Tax=Nocardioides nanhaiensis TaxID=1476871 RepID=A0ABP8W9B9_9ACTN
MLSDPTPRLATAADWLRYREARLRMLADSPDAFMTTLAQAEAQGEEFWRGRVGGTFPTWLVTDDTDTAGDAGAVVATGGVFVPEPEGHAPTAHVVAMWTAAEARGRGLAARILEVAVDWCREQGLDEDLRLHVTEGNALARRLYLRHGFSPTGAWEPLREGSPLRCEELRLARPDADSGDAEG